jgi:hypothetical protein
MNPVDNLRHKLKGNQGNRKSGEKISDYLNIREGRRISLNLMPCYPDIHYLIPG